MRSDFLRPPSNLLKRIQSLSKKKWRKEHGTFVLEGPKILEEAYRADLEILSILFAESYWDSEGAGHIKNFVDERDTFVLRDSDFSKISSTETPQGVLAEIAIPDIPRLDSLETAQAPIIVLEEIQDPGNVGTAVRSSAALGGQAVLLTEGCADIWNPKTLRATAGAVFHLPVIPDLSIGEITEHRRSIGGSLLIATAEGESLHTVGHPEPPTLIVFGNESRGPSKLWEKSPSSRKVGIPMDSRIESLNVGVSVAAFLAVLQEKKFQNPVR